MLTSGYDVNNQLAVPERSDNLLSSSKGIQHPVDSVQSRCTEYMGLVSPEKAEGAVWITGSPRDPIPPAKSPREQNTPELKNRLC